MWQYNYDDNNGGRDGNINNTRKEGEKNRKGARIRRLENDILMLESDIKKNQQKLDSLGVETKKLERERARIDFEIEVIKKEKKKLEKETLVWADDLRRLKKKIKLL